MKLFDTHVHLSDAKFQDLRSQVLENMKAAGVELCIDVACDLRKVQVTRKLSDENANVYAAYGMHPHYANAFTSDMLTELAEHMTHEKCVALGEIGLDYHYDFSPRDAQKRCFREQLELALALKVPVILHIREAFGDCMEILRSVRGRGLYGVMHCYSGSYEVARECMDMGLHIAFGGSLTFSGAHGLREVAAKLPLERVLLETDCPYLAPVPLRGKLNEPANIVYVAQQLASLHGISAEDAAQITFKNAVELFGINTD